MIPGLSGSLLSHDALERMFAGGEGNGQTGDLRTTHRRLRAWHLPLRCELGPATSARGCFDRLASPLFAQLGYRVVPAAGGSQTYRAVLFSRGMPTVGLVVTPWGTDPNGVWREAVHFGIATGVSWCFCVTGPSVRIIDAARTYSRRFAELDLDRAIDDERAFAVFWGLLGADAIRSEVPGEVCVLEKAIRVSEEQRANVRASLQRGVDEALTHLTGAFRAAVRFRSRRRRTVRELLDPVRAFDESLVIVYRILFLLFAEARGMVPHWHPVYRDGYTMESINGSVSRPDGLWETLQAIARLAHQGCQIGALRVTAFNGRLFSPQHSPLADTLVLDDRAVRQAFVALTTRAAHQGRVTIAFGDLGVEQLGGIYERILDLEPAPAGAGRAPHLIPTGRRKATGSFYTPRSVADYLVRRTLSPLVSNASPEEVLELRILDPAMGSGAFLVSACRFLASAYESALLREGGIFAGDITGEERAAFRRAIAQRCLYGVDINPMAVQVGRLSLWLATLAADRPLTFLDHRLRTGNSLVGATLGDIVRQPPGAGRKGRISALPLFLETGEESALAEAAAIRTQIAAGPGDTLEQVRSKERALEELEGRDSRLARWKVVADLWCSTWFADRATAGKLTRAFGALRDEVLDRGVSLPPCSSAGLLATGRNVAASERFFHWSLEFPEIFCNDDGTPRARPGFDAVIGNPPWEMLRGDSGDAADRVAARATGSALTDFARSSGVYRLQGDGHTNLYQLFVERALALVRDGGRLGLVLPSGFAIDTGSAPLRRAVLHALHIDALVSIQNRDGLFPIHRGLKFMLLSASRAAPGAALPCRFGLRSPADLDRLPEQGHDPQALRLSQSFLERFGGVGLSIPDVRSATDLDIAAHSLTSPALGDAEGWNVHFGRELNATEDRQYFVDAATMPGLPVIEGKQIFPFVVDTGAVRYRIPRKAAAALRGTAESCERPRLAYRDVASATNRVSLIAAIIPAGCVTTHTVFCLREHLPAEAQLYLCGMFNSYVANYLIRLRITTHISAAVIDRLRVPVPPPGTAMRRELVRLSARLSGGDDPYAAARLQAIAARLYGLTREQFAHVLGTFPLVPTGERDAAMTAFCDIFERRSTLE